MDTPFGKVLGITRARTLDILVAGRREYVVAAAIAVFGFGLAGVSAGTAPDQPAASAATAPVAQAPGKDSPAEPADRQEPGSPTDGQQPDEPTDTPDWVSPMPGAEVTSGFGLRWGTMHAGTDFAQPENAPVFAVGGGTVFGEGWLYTGYGISVVIDHGDGTFTHYAHLNKTNVQPGQQVAAGDLIGWEGSTGDSTGPHLHFEVHRGGLWNQVDPASWLDERGVHLDR